MKIVNNKGKNGIYGIVIGCAFAIGIIGLGVSTNLRSNIEKSKTANVAAVSTPSPKMKEENPVSEKKEVQTQPVQAAPVKVVPAKQPAEEEKNEATAPPAPEYAAPVDGKISVPFSKEPVYSQTFDDYRSHSGIDIEAEKGSPVKAISDGTIKKIYTDSLYGIVIEITHADGVKSRYCGMGSGSKLKTGDTVKSGDEIGVVGVGFPAEKEQQPHIHLEMYKDGEAVNPMDYLS